MFVCECAGRTDDLAVIPKALDVDVVLCVVGGGCDHAVR